jgi:phosphoribosyl-AMP cyclohydrolase
MSGNAPQGVRFGTDGLAPVVVQDAVSGDVLMLAYMNEDALRLTHKTGRAHYWSRGRGALWRKGETSGHEQMVDEIRVNCERNSLLLLVRQVGAVCHDGYPSCFYRRAGPDGSLTIVRERSFDPSVVYPESLPAPQSHETMEIYPLAEATRQQFGAYAYLRDHDLTSESETSRRLRHSDSDKEFRSRIADELRELAGVLDGQHRHDGREHDVLLEASQVIYWLLLESLRNGVTWMTLQPDRALTTVDLQLPAATTGRLLRAEADRWSENAPKETDVAASAHATLSLVGQACVSAGLDPLAAVQYDIVELESRPYLAPYFGHRTR